MRRTAASLIPLLCLVLPCLAQVSTNVPLDHWAYGAADKLANYGLIDSAMLSTKPISRIEMARHVTHAMRSLKHMEEPPPVLASIIERLKEEFRGELIQIGVLEGHYGSSFIKPIEDPYFKYLYADVQPELENTRGDTFERHSNYRAGFATRARISNTIAFYLHPEYRDAPSEASADVDLIEGYGKVMVGPVEVQAGKDSLWWGPGHHGSILMSNNARPLRMIKVTNPQPLQLPWVLRYLGPFRSQWFMAQLEEDRDIPEARVSGMRLNFKPHARWEVGLSRVVMFGGRGVPRVDLFDYGKMFLARSEQEENNQLAGFDTSILLPLAEIPYGRHLPMRSIKLYFDGAGEDEAGMLPSNWGFLYGVQLNDILKTGRTDIRIEYADNHVTGKPNVFYNHSLYTSGYTYKGRVMGHHMGTDSRDLFAQLSHYVTDDLIFDIVYDRQTHNLSEDNHPRLNTVGCNLTFFPSSQWRILAGYRYEDGEGEDYDDNHVVQLQLIRDF